VVQTHSTICGPGGLRREDVLDMMINHSHGICGDLGSNKVGALGVIIGVHLNGVKASRRWKRTNEISANHLPRRFRDG
jgi:hypothetical protein